MKKYINRLLLIVFAPMFKWHYQKWYAWQFKLLPYRKSFSSNEGQFDSIVIIPMNYKHDSGFACMDFIGIREEKPVCRLSGCSDVIHIDGIGGYGKDQIRFKSAGFPDKINIHGWSVDCLYRSKLLRLFSNNRLEAGAALSSFEIFSIKPPNP